MYNTTDFIIRRLEKGDSNNIAKLHLKAFNGFFLTSLGASFLRKFYQCIVAHPQGVALGAFRSGELIGFVVGTEKNGGFYKSVLKKHGLNLALLAFTHLVLKPQKVLQLFSNINRGDFRNFHEWACLLSICVSPGAASQGVGQRLIRVFQQELKERGVNRVFLTTDAMDNEGVNSFYQKNNFVLNNTYQQSTGRQMNVYTKLIS